MKKCNGKKVGQECRFWTRWLWSTVQPHVFTWCCKGSLVPTSCSATRTALSWLALQCLMMYLPLTSANSLIWWWTVCQSFCVCFFPTDELWAYWIVYFSLPSMISYRSPASSCLMFSPISLPPVCTHTQTHTSPSYPCFPVCHIKWHWYTAISARITDETLWCHCEETATCPFPWLSLELCARCLSHISGSVTAGLGTPLQSLAVDLAAVSLTWTKGLLLISSRRLRLLEL